MSEWPMVKLGEVAEDVPWVTPKDLSNRSNLWISSGSRSITELGLAKSGAILLPRKTVLWSSRAPIGLVAIASNPIATNQGFKSFIPGQNLDSNYLAHFLIQNQTKLQTLGVGATFKEVSARRAAEIQIPLPPLREQKRIAEILGNIQNAIELTSLQLDDISSSMKIESWTLTRDSPQTQLSHYIKKITSGKSLKEGNWGNFQNCILKISAVTTGFFDDSEIKPLPESYTPQASHKVELTQQNLLELQQL